MQIYLARNNVQAGPYTLTQFNNMLQSQETALEDLMWHEGMNDWKKIGDVTYGKYEYLPDNSTELTKNNLTVDELYGREAKKPVGNDELEALEKLIKNKDAKTKIISIGSTKGKSSYKFGLASIVSRMLAVALDQLTFLMCLVPIILNTDKKILEAFQTQNVTEIQQYLEALPESALLMFVGMFLLTFLLQVLLLIKRGQTLGKLATGIRILDVKNNQLPSITNIVLLRTIVTNVLYALPAVGHFILMIDAVFMITDPNKRSLHDKLAGTYVVKAKSEQLTPKINITK